MCCAEYLSEQIEMERDIDRLHKRVKELESVLLFVVNNSGLSANYNKKAREALGI